MTKYVNSEINYVLFSARAHLLIQPVDQYLWANEFAITQYVHVDSL